MFMELAAWGWLPLAVPVLVMAAWNLALLTFPKDGWRRRLGAFAVLGMVLVHASVGVLGTFGVLSTGSLLGALACVAGGAWWSARHIRRAPPPRFTATELMPSVALGVVTVGLAVVAARVLPVCQWDAFGYHLPYVNLVLQHGGFADVPPDLRYISTYPHNIELGMIWLRAMLGDDRLVDLAQIPYGLSGAVLTAVVARELGAQRALALLAGVAWLTLPAVFLQLPTNYVDVGTAAALLGALYFVLLAPVSPAGLVVGALSLGLFLGSKPSAPLAAVVVGVALVVRGVRAGQMLAVGLSVLAVLVFGAEMYAVMWVRHGNPVWPVAVQLGPWRLPGEHSVAELLAAGSALPRATGGLLEQVSVSWLAVDTSPVFDMRLGGLGVLFVVALPLAIAGLVRRRAGWLVLAVLVSVLSPDPSVPRYVLAFAAMVLAVALAQVPRRARFVASGVVLCLSLIQLHHAWPGLVGDGPSFETYWHMTEDERRIAVGPQGRPTDYPPAWALVEHGESVAFDIDFEFPGLLWAPDLHYPVYALPRRGSVMELTEWLDAHHVRLLAVGEQHRALVAQRPEWRLLFACRSAPCGVYARTEARASR